MNAESAGSSPRGSPRQWRPSDATVALFYGVNEGSNRADGRFRSSACAPLPWRREAEAAAVNTRRRRRRTSEAGANLRRRLSLCQDHPPPPPHKENNYFLPEQFEILWRLAQVNTGISL